MDYIKVLLMLVSGIAWTIVYISSIQIGFRHKNYAIPFWAIALNIAWEIFHGVFDLWELGPQLQIIINGVWALFDVVILYTYFKYGRRYFPKNIKTGWFYTWSIAGLIISFAIQYIFIVEFGTMLGGGYAAFLQNLLMSFLFIAMFIQRNGTEGQSLTIAISKWIGTLAPTVLFGIIGSNSMGGPNRFMLGTGIIIAVIDTAYIVIIANAKRREKKGIKSDSLF